MFVQAKETYHARCMEFEKLKRDRAAQKDIERAENRAKRARECLLALCTTDYFCKPILIRSSKLGTSLEGSVCIKINVIKH